MANAQSIILHQFERSPFSEKIRLALRMKNLGWASVDIPSILPKPDLTPLTGGYRRTPVMQIGADIFCDTSIMLIELEKRFQIPSLNLPGHEGIAKMVGAWTDGKWFQSSVAVIFGANFGALTALWFGGMISGGPSIGQAINIENWQSKYSKNIPK